MKVEEEIRSFIGTLPEPKRNEVQELHRRMLKLLPQCKLWFEDGRDSENQAISNPTIGYGNFTIKYSNGKTREFFQVGISANKTGISVYILGIKDKRYLVQTYENKIGKAKVTGYCIRFKSIKDLHIDMLESAILYGVRNSSEQ